MHFPIQRGLAFTGGGQELPVTVGLWRMLRASWCASAGMYGRGCTYGVTGGMYGGVYQLPMVSVRNMGLPWASGPLSRPRCDGKEGEGGEESLLPPSSPLLRRAYRGEESSSSSPLLSEEHNEEKRAPPPPFSS